MWDCKGLKKRQLTAIGYLATLPKYRLMHYGNNIVLEHFGKYGYGYGSGTYNKWEEVASHTYGTTLNEDYNGCD
jgi:hypothetical protein